MTTPGPWRLNYHRDGRWDGSLVMSNGHEIELSVRIGDCSLEDALLIAAAPEMLARLERTKELLKRIQWDFGDACPECAAEHEDGHEEGCELAELIKEPPR